MVLGGRDGLEKNRRASLGRRENLGSGAGKGSQFYKHPLALVLSIDPILLLGCPALRLLGRKPGSIKWARLVSRQACKFSAGLGDGGKIASGWSQRCIIMHMKDQSHPL